MPVMVNNLIHENEAMRSQVGFVKSCVNRWKAETDLEALTQLIQTTYYLREGLNSLYGQEDDLLLIQLDASTSAHIKSKHKAVMNSLDKVYQLLIDLNPERLQAIKEYLTETIDHLCHSITQLSIQENAILK